MRETTGIESARERLRLPGLKPARFAKGDGVRAGADIGACNHEP